LGRKRLGVARYKRKTPRTRKKGNSNLSHPMKDGIRKIVTLVKRKGKPGGRHKWGIF